MVSSGFHSPVSSLSRVSEVHRLVLFRVSFSSEFTFPCVRTTWLNGLFTVSFTSEFMFTCFRGAQFTGFMRVSYTSEFTFLSVRGGWFTGFFRVSFISEVTFPCVRGAWLSGFLRVSSQVSTLCHVSEVYVSVISIGFHSPVSSLSCFRVARFILFIRVSFSSEGTFPCQRCTV